MAGREEESARGSFDPHADGGVPPNLEIRHERQTLGMEGPNLAEKRCRQILKHAPETPLGKIQKMDDSHFEVQSSKTKQSYHIDLNTITCNCRDFPRIRLCKHIAAVAHFFGGVDLGPRPPDNTSASELPNSPVQQDSSAGAGSTDDDATASLISAANNMIRVTQELISNTPRDLHIAKSITNGRRWFPLPEKEVIGPNQLSWLETAARMGVQHDKKRQGKGKVDSALTAQHIGVPNRKRAPITTHMEQESNLANVQSPMPAQPPPMLERGSRDAQGRAPATIINTGTPVDVWNDALQTPLVLASQPPSTLPSTHPPPTPLPLPRHSPCPRHSPYSILAEPDNLSSTSSQLTNALTNLCTSSYPTFLSLHSTTTGLTSTLSIFSNTLDTLLDNIPVLESSASTFSSEITSIQSSRRRAALVLEHSSKLQDILELSMLADT
ncbi:hypothetical protein BGY98DRAFT_1099611 [Russula aff. rugulosa BPL654]|nr:hypothetical protein BGY98DRAFT_1099611 [Russula aff. rugulosa BPL654]